MSEELTVGFRFYPTEDELIAFYLRNKLEGRIDDSMHRVIPVLDVFEVEPSHLPSTLTLTSVIWPQYRLERNS